MHASLEAVLEVLLDQRAHFLRTQIICVVVAGGEHIGADHHPPAHFSAKAIAAGLLIHIDDLARYDGVRYGLREPAREVRSERRHSARDWTMLPRAQRCNR